jgi:hypothetical protein
MPTNYGNGGVFDYGNVLRNVSQIQNRNALTRNELDPNSLQNQLYAAKIRDLDNPTAAYDPTAPMRNYAERERLIASGATPEQIETFDNYVRAMQIKKIGGVQTKVTPGGNVPLGTLQDEGAAAAYLSNQQTMGGQQAEAGISLPTPITADELDLSAPPPVSQAELAAAEKTATKEAEYKADYKWKSVIAARVKEAEAAAKERGEVLTDLSRMKATLPGLQASITQLKKLSNIATYTVAGKAWDAAVRQSGFGATEGATARAKFMSIVDNQVLPLLRQTFGAAFTAEEGNRLRATMGDPDLSPEEKNAQLDAFIAQKIRDVESKERQLGSEELKSLSTEQLKALEAELLQ